jgi:hypothetical protein
MSRRACLTLSDTYVVMPLVVHELVEHAVPDREMEWPEELERRCCLFRMRVPPDQLNPRVHSAWAPHHHPQKPSMRPEQPRKLHNVLQSQTCMPRVCQPLILNWDGQRQVGWAAYMHALAGGWA